MIESWLCCVCFISDVAYVTYSKASEAANAIEEMNGKVLKDKGRPVKVSKTCSDTTYCMGMV